ncbi:MAG TPA: hypothetical protein VE685_15240, partial [Thermoanaerobaculia bacterium]|nr:hypothetical protein [Thermoanaerobaculia bacterium]
CLGFLLSDEAARARLAECARQRLLGAYRWGANMDRFEDLIGSAVRPGGPQLVGGRLLLRENPPEPGTLAEGARSA